jgi:hypothetical protein
MTAPYEGVIFRACRNFPARAADLQSDAERKRPGKDRPICENWGLSVWTTEDGVSFARDALAFTRKRFIVRFNVAQNDGRLQKTPTGNQPEHHFTFWKFATANLTNATLHLEPVKSDAAE